MPQTSNQPPTSTCGMLPPTSTATTTLFHLRLSIHKTAILGQSSLILLCLKLRQPIYPAHSPNAGVHTVPQPQKPAQQSHHSSPASSSKLTTWPASRSMQCSS